MGKLWTTVGGKRVRTHAGIVHQYEKWDGTDKYKKKRASRNSARLSAMKSGRVHKGDGKDVHHADHNANNNSASNLRVMSASKNRGISEKSRKRGSRRASWKRG